MRIQFWKHLINKWANDDQKRNLQCNNHSNSISQSRENLWYSIIWLIRLVSSRRHKCFSSWNVIYAKSNEVINSDNEINRRRDISSNIVYANINKSAILDKSYITLFSNNKFMSNRKNEIKTHFIKDFE